MDINKWTIKTQQAMHEAQQLASSNGQQAIETGHLLRGMITVDDSFYPLFLKNSIAIKTLLRLH